MLASTLPIATWLNIMRQHHDTLVSLAPSPNCISQIQLPRSTCEMDFQKLCYKLQHCLTVEYPSVIHIMTVSIFVKFCKDYQLCRFGLNRISSSWLIWTRTTRTPMFWDTPRHPMITHTRDSHQIPSQNKTKSKLQMLKNFQKFKSYNFCIKLYTWHIFWSCLIRCVNMKWIQSEL